MASSIETRQFRMHSQLLYDVIRRQAGTLSKAILEGIMNMVDAGAKKGVVTLLPKRVVLEDNGQGFRSREEIEKWFEVFGQPHDKSEGKTYGTFRMGRGQMFAFGKNTWRTGKFSMEVDIKGRGLDYDLLDQSKAHKGCKIEIELYDQLMPSDMDSVIRDLEDWVKGCPMPVLLNDQRISNDPAKATWDTVTDEAYIKLKPTGGLSVYNLGVHVLTFPGYKYGTGGEVVSRQQVKVNFARNDIQADCPVWKVVRGVVDVRAATKVQGKKALNDNERQRLADRLLTGDLTPTDARQMRLITAATGRQYDMQVFHNTHQWPQVTNAPKGSRKADKLMKQKVAFVVANETLERFRVSTVRCLLDRFAAIEDRGHMDWGRIKVVDFKTLTKGMSDKFDVFTEDEYNPTERLWLLLMQHGIERIRCTDRKAAYRRLQIGTSSTAAGWTDGASYICVGRAFLKRQRCTMASYARVGRLLLHEMCHQSPDLEDHDHDQEFYEEFHDHADHIGNFVEAVMAYLPKACEKLKRKLTREQLGQMDLVAKADAAIAEFPHVAVRKP